MADIVAPQFALQGNTSHATIVSIYPFNIREFKPGLIPNIFRIPAAKDDIVVFYVEDAKFPVYMDSERGSIWVTVPALLLANSIIFDFVTAQHRYLAPVPEEKIVGAMPGLFYLPGKISKVEIKDKHKHLIEHAISIQNSWFESLVKEADDDWVRYQKHAMITDVQRHACKALHIERAWAVELKSENFKQCPACSNRIHQQAIRCQHCGTVLDIEKFKKLSLAMA